MPLLAGGAALISPPVVALNWQIAQFLSVLRFFIVKEKLKAFDGLDVDEIRRKDLELKMKFDMGQSFIQQELDYDYDEVNGDIKVIDEPVYLKNETQRNFD